MSATPDIQAPSAGRWIIRLAKAGISLVYLLGQIVWLRVQPVPNRTGSGRGVVLYYHNVPLRYRGRFEEQMKMLARHANPITLNNLDEMSAGTHSVAVTFDDGLESFAQHAVPVLQKLNIPATVFVTAGALGTKPKWGASYYDAGEKVMSEDQLRGLPDIISVGSHSLTHPDLPSLSKEAAAREITESRKKLERLLQRPVTTFSFPHGEFNESVLSQCREAGYERVVTINPTLIKSGEVDYIVGRVAVDPWDWPLEFRLKMRGAYCWQPKVAPAKRWINRLFSRSTKAQSAEISGPQQIGS